MKDYISLKILDWFQWIFSYYAVDYHRLRQILELKLTLDRRRVSVIFNEKQENSDKQYYLNYLFYLIYGLFFTGLLFLPVTIFLKMTFLYSMLIFFLSSVMIADFSQVLLDVKDKNILFAKPIEMNTINMAKITHIFIYLLTLSFAFTFAPIIGGIFNEGFLFFLLFIPLMFFLLAFIVFLTAFFYGVILHFFDSEKLKNIINYIQIIIAIILPMGFYFSGNLLSLFENGVFQEEVWWIYLLPPAWFAAPFHLFLEADYTFVHILLSLLAIVVPVIGLFIYQKVISPYFESNLSKLDNISHGKKMFFKERFFYKITSLISRSREESIFIRFIDNIVSRDRKLKLSIYPILGFAVVFPLFFIRDSLDLASFTESIKEASNGFSFMWLYFSLVFLALIVQILHYNANYKAAWIYKALPIENFNNINKAKIKLVFIKYCTPLFIVLSIFLIFIFGIALLKNIILIYSNMLFLLIFAGIKHRKDLPFVQDFGTNNKKTGQITLNIQLYLISAIAAFLHFIWLRYDFNFLILIGFTLFLIFFLWKLFLNKEFNPFQFINFKFIAG